MIVCSCFAVSSRQIDAAVEAGAADIDAVGKACDAGTGCGSCRERIAERLACGGRTRHGWGAGRRERVVSRAS